MKKLTFKFFLSLCIILLSGYSLFSVHGSKDYANFSQKNTIQNQLQHVYSNAGYDKVGHSGFTSTEAEDFKYDFTDSEDKDDDLIYFIKKGKKDNYFASIFYPLTSGYYFRHIQNSFSNEGLFYYPTARRHVIFSVFRI